MNALISSSLRGTIGPGHMSVYDDAFYRAQQEGSLRSAREVLPLVFSYVKPRRVVDLGCGVGAWLAVARELGASEVLGIDGPWVKPADLRIPESRFRAADVTRPPAEAGPFDLAISLEVGEHLEAARAAAYVTALTQLAPVVLFSAAVPFQQGTAHVNEQWPDYWARLFGVHDYVPIDCLRRALWENDRVEWWYAQNALFYARRARLDQYPRLAAAFDNAMPMALVHPRKYRSMAAEIESQRALNHVSLGRLLRQIPIALKNGLARRLARRRPPAESP